MSCLFVEHLTVIDCAYLDADRGLVGASWIVDLELEGDLDEQSMVLDFGEVKRRIKRAIDASVDHSLLVPRQAPGLQARREGDLHRLAWTTARGRIEHEAPAVAVSELDTVRVEPDAVIAYLLPRLRDVAPANVADIRLHLREEAVDGARYRYVHGLKKHAGHCQRIAHGHRSRIEIRVDGERSAPLEAALARRWAEIYLGTREDLVGEHDGLLHFAYTAPEGRFALALPAAHVEVLDGDTTVECLADWIAGWAAANASPAHTVQVRAYEGVMKGALANRKASAG